MNDNGSTPILEGQIQSPQYLYDISILTQPPPKTLPLDQILVIHLPDLSKVCIKYNQRENISSVRKRLQEQISFDQSKYYFVSSHGAIKEGHTLDNYHLSPMADIILVKRGQDINHKLKTRNFWLKQHDKRLNKNLSHIVSRSGRAIIKKPFVYTTQLDPYVFYT